MSYDYTSSPLYQTPLTQPEGTKEIQSDGLALAIFRATDFLHVSAKRKTK